MLLPWNEGDPLIADSMVLSAQALQQPHLKLPGCIGTVMRVILEETMGCAGGALLHSADADAGECKSGGGDTVRCCHRFSDGGSRRGSCHAAAAADLRCTASYSQNIT